jgi:hypothetical protein
MDIPKKCKTCGFNPITRPMGALHKNNPIDINMVKEYCEKNAIPERHKVVAVWKKCCGYLDHYSVIITMPDKPLWKI